MSLTRQLWLAVLIVMILAFGGTFAISTWAARHYFAQQLRVKNIDNATTLALSMSQMDKDPVTIELLISAQFDAGHYRLIRLTDPKGAVIVERHNEAPVENVPAVFVAAVPLDVEPGIAQVQDGWKQYGTLTLESHDQYAYAELWRGTLRLLGWFVLLAVAVGMLGSLLLRYILQPLAHVITQAQAIGDRRFITQPEPRTIEFRQLVRAMNTLSGLVRQMLEAESQRVEQLRQQAQIDPLTGLRNRETFIASLEDALVRDDRGASGVLVIVRVTELAELNRAVGRETADQILRRVGERLSRAAQGHATLWVVARLNAADFAVMAPGETDARTIADNLLQQAQLAFERPEGEASVIRVGCSAYERGESRTTVLARADSALAKAEQAAHALVEAEHPQGEPPLPTDAASWRATLEEAMRSGVQLGRYAVTRADGSVLHHESPVRLRIGQHWLPASRFIAWAARLGLLPRLDSLVVEAALQQLQTRPGALSINVSAETVCDPGFAALLIRKLRHAPDQAARLWLEVPEYGALRHLPEFRRFCQTLQPLGCKLGLKHAGLQFSRISELHDLGLDYLKIDGSLVQSLDDGPGHEVFLRGLCSVAHSIGLTTIAAGIDHDIGLQRLADLGIDGFTGPAIDTP